MPFGTRLNQIRKIKNLTQEEIGHLVGVSKQAISNYEKGKDYPSPNTLEKICKELGVSNDYFFRTVTIAKENVKPTFRENKELSKSVKDKIIVKIIDKLEKQFELYNIANFNIVKPQINKIKISNMKDINDAALSLRSIWNIGNDPIENLVKILEINNFIVIDICDEEKFDACIFPYYHLKQDCWIVAYNSNMPFFRQRFNIAHELGHVILENRSPDDDETNANLFASSFLLSNENLFREFGEKRSNVSINELLNVKKDWGISMQAILVRLKQSKVIDNQESSKIWAIISKNGWKYSEPLDNEYPSEKPSIFINLARRLYNEEVLSYRKLIELAGSENIIELDRATGKVA